MSFDAGSLLSAIVTKAAAVSNVNGVYTGFPESVAYKLAAVVFLGAIIPRDKAVNGCLERTINVNVDFVYRVKGAEADAESSLAAAVDEFHAAIFLDRTIGGLVASAQPDSRAGDAPDYIEWAGQEFRRYPVAVECVQRDQMTSL